MRTEKYRSPLLDVETILPILNRISLLGGLDDAQLYTIFHILETEHYAAGEFIFSQGDPPDHIRIVHTGRVRIIEEVDGTWAELAEFGAGQCFGETSVIAIHPHTASALALEECELLVIPRDKMFRLHDTDPKLFGILMLNIAREACRRLKKAENTMLHYALDKEKKS